MKDPIEQISKKTWSYWYVDGLVEIGAGAIIFLIGLCYLLPAFLPPSPARAFLTALIIPIIVFAGGWISRRLIRFIKERLTFPRTGYIRYRQPPRSRRWLRMGITILIAVFLSVLVTLLLRAVSRNLIPAITGALLAVYAVYLAQRVGVNRFYAVAVCVFLIGILVSWLNLPESIDAAAFFGGVGLVWMISGAAALIHYLRTTSPAPPEEDV